MLSQIRNFISRFVPPSEPQFRGRTNLERLRQIAEELETGIPERGSGKTVAKLHELAAAITMTEPGGTVLCVITQMKDLSYLMPMVYEVLVSYRIELSTAGVERQDERWVNDFGRGTGGVDSCVLLRFIPDQIERALGYRDVFMIDLTHEHNSRVVRERAVGAGR